MFTSGQDGRAIFPGFRIWTADKVEWRNIHDHSEGGVYWTGTDVNGIHWVTDGEDRMAVLPARAFRFYRKGVRERLMHLTFRYLNGLVGIRRDAYVINFGANIGEIAVELATQGAQVMAIEPDPGIVPYLSVNAAGRKIEVIPAAAWNADTDVMLYLKTDSADSSVFNFSERAATVPGRKIDTLTTERGVGHVHLLVGDAEGAEPEVLEGAAETLRMTEYVSICASDERCGESTQAACDAILKAAGFDILLREESGFGMLVGRNRAFAKEAA